MHIQYLLYTAYSYITILFKKVTIIENCFEVRQQFTAHILDIISHELDLLDLLVIEYISWNGTYVVLYRYICDT